MTVNAELQSKIDESAQTNDDMSNLLSGTQIATVFLSNDLRIKRFTPSAIDVISLIQTDVGRPVSDMASKLEYQDLAQDAGEVLRTLVLQEREVRARSGQWYLVRIMPYRTLANVIDGAVVTFVDISAQKQAQEDLRHARDFAENIVETVREPLLVLDPDLRVITANKAFYTTFKGTPQETVQRRIYDLGDHHWDIPALREVLEKILPEQTQLNDFVVEHDFPALGRRRLVLNARAILQDRSRSESILLAIEDRTGRE